MYAKKISSVDALLITQNVLSWSGRFGGGHIGWSQLQLASSVSPLWISSFSKHVVRISVLAYQTNIFWSTYLQFIYSYGIGFFVRHFENICHMCFEAMFFHHLMMIILFSLTFTYLSAWEFQSNKVVYNICCSHLTCVSHHFREHTIYLCPLSVFRLTTLFCFVIFVFALSSKPSTTHCHNHDRPWTQFLQRSNFPPLDKIVHI